MPKNIILIGAMGRKGVVYDGQTFKNKLFIKQFSKFFDTVYTVNTTRWKYRPWVLIQLLYCILFCRQAKVVISTCDENAYRIIKFLYYFRFQKEVFYWVVGGGLQNFFAQGIFKSKYFLYLRNILVQSPEMVTSLNTYGLQNVTFIPNSKIIYETSNQQKNNFFRFVFVSRIIKEKGYGEILNAVEQLNNEGLNGLFSVSFWGLNIELNDFEKRISNIDNVEFKGLLDLTSKAGYDELSCYDVFLFPTYYPNEGFPGVIIDAFIAGLPVVTTDWNYNKEIVKDGINGFIIPPKNSDALNCIMKKIIKGEIDLRPISINARKEATNYDADVILGHESLHSIGLID